MRHVGILVLVGLFLSGCAFDDSGLPGDEPPADDPDGPVTTSIPADPGSLPGQSADPVDEGPWAYTLAERRAIVDVANIATQTELDDDVPLDSRAAENIIVHRDGADTVFGTADDDPFDDLFELDDVSYVGATALENLLEYAYAAGYLN